MCCPRFLAPVSIHNYEFDNYPRLTIEFDVNKLTFSQHLLRLCFIIICSKLLKKESLSSRDAVVVVSFPKGRIESCRSLRQVGLLHDRGRHHLSHPLQFRHGMRKEGNILQLSVPLVSTATTHKTFESTDLTSTYSVCIWRVIGGIEYRT
ncbi:hypothetical protein TNCV_1075451 [Trichonephila clavipes]|uniref:Uncharacterized protein n=1 Tax=Trichonephila clavipes TaxID=2585209 RepID=A0A8X6VRE5_TRICX|nr:hypothetical protein TNCV_1075451 [Trichonephila clavipes]